MLDWIKTVCFFIAIAWVFFNIAEGIYQRAGKYSYTNEHCKRFHPGGDLVCN